MVRLPASGPVGGAGYALTPLPGQERRKWGTSTPHCPKAPWQRLVETDRDISS